MIDVAEADLDEVEIQISSEDPFWVTSSPTFSSSSNFAPGSTVTWFQVGT